MSSNDFSKIISAFTVYKLLRDVVIPFTQTKAYKLGIIDANGNYLTNFDELSPYDRLVIGIKKLISKVPDPPFQAKMRNISTSLALLGEEIESMGGNKTDFIDRIKKSFTKLGINNIGE